MTPEAYDTFDAMKARLDEIVDEVNADGVSLDEALALYEEAVELGLHASDLLEEDDVPPDAVDVSSAHGAERSAGAVGSDEGDTATGEAAVTA